MKTIKTTLIVSALALLGGCVGVPVNSGYYPEPQPYYAPAAVYIAPPVIFPSISFGYRGGRGGHRHRHH